MRQIKTKNIQIPLKSDSFKPFLKLILFNDKMGYLNRWLANCKINQNMVRSTRVAIRRTVFFVFWLLLSVYHITLYKSLQTMTPGKFLSFSFLFLQAGVDLSNTRTPQHLRKTGIRNALLFNKQEISNAIPRMFLFSHFCGIKKFFTALISILSGKQLHVWLLINCILSIYSLAAATGRCYATINFQLPQLNTQWIQPFCAKSLKMYKEYALLSISWIARKKLERLKKILSTEIPVNLATEDS